MPKPPSSVLKAYRVRVDGEDDERVTKFFQKFGDKYLLVHHVTTTDNPHYHAYVETTYSQGNFSNKIKEVLGVKGGDYSNKTCDTDRRIEYLGYLFNTKKGNKSRLVVYDGFSPIDVATYQANARAVADEFQARMSSSKKTQYEMCQMVLERIDKKDFISPDKVYDCVIDVLKACHTMARPNHVRDMIATVMAYSESGKAKEFVKNLTLKFFSKD